MNEEFQQAMRYASGHMDLYLLLETRMKTRIAMDGIARLTSTGEALVAHRVADLADDYVDLWIAIRTDESFLQQETNRLWSPKSKTLVELVDSETKPGFRVRLTHGKRVNNGLKAVDRLISTTTVARQAEAAMREYVGEW